MVMTMKEMMKVELIPDQDFLPDSSIPPCVMPQLTRLINHFNLVRTNLFNRDFFSMYSNLNESSQARPNREEAAKAACEVAEAEFQACSQVAKGEVGTG